MTSPIAARTLEIATQKVNAPDASAATYNTAAELWNTYTSRLIASGHPIRAHDVLQMLGLLAMSHTITHMNAPLPANFIEQAACVAGAAEAAGVEYPTLMKQTHRGEPNKGWADDDERRLHEATADEQPQS